MQKIGEPAPAPMEYIDMVILPRMGYSYSAVKRLTLAEKHLLLAMLSQEADPIYRPVVK